MTFYLDIVLSTFFLLYLGLDGILHLCGNCKQKCSSAYLSTTVISLYAQEKLRLFYKAVGFKIMVLLYLFFNFWNELSDKEESIFLNIYIFFTYLVNRNHFCVWKRRSLLEYLYTCKIPLMNQLLIFYIIIPPA